MRDVKIGILEWFCVQLVLWLVVVVELSIATKNEGKSCLRSILGIVPMQVHALGKKGRRERERQRSNTNCRGSALTLPKPRVGMWCLLRSARHSGSNVRKKKIAHIFFSNPEFLQFEL